MLYLYFIQNRDRPDTTTFTSGQEILQQNNDGQTNFFDFYKMAREYNSEITMNRQNVPSLEVVRGYYYNIGWTDIIFCSF